MLRPAGEGDAVPEHGSEAGVGVALDLSGGREQENVAAGVERGESGGV